MQPKRIQKCAKIWGREEEKKNETPDSSNICVWRKSIENVLFGFWWAMRTSHISNNNFISFYRTFFCGKMCIQSLSLAIATIFLVLQWLLLLSHRLLQPTVSKVGTHMAIWHRSTAGTALAHTMHACDGTKCLKCYEKQQRRSPVVIMWTVDRLVPVYCLDLRWDSIVVFPQNSDCMKS